MKMLGITTIACAILGFFDCKAQVKNIGVSQFAAAVEAKARVVDVRTAGEFVGGHIPGASNMDWNQAAFREMVEKKFDKSAPLYLYCRSGRRSAEAAKVLDKAGYDVYNLLGGIIAWTESGRPISR